MVPRPFQYKDAMPHYQCGNADIENKMVSWVFYKNDRNPMESNYIEISPDASLHCDRGSADKPSLPVHDLYPLWPWLSWFTW